MEIDQQFPAGFIGLADYFPIDYVQYSSQPNPTKAHQNIQKQFFWPQMNDVHQISLWNCPRFVLLSFSN
jgi:hypothetical protein